jgi:hypothetical protein
MVPRAATPSGSGPVSPVPTARAPGGRARTFLARGGALRGIAGFAAAILIVGFVSDRIAGGTDRERATGEPRVTIPPAVAHGTLVYVSNEGVRDGRQTLWKLDLATGDLQPGPEVPTASHLLAATYAGPGWLGLDAATGDGTMHAFLLEGSSPSVVPVPLGAGALVAWGPLGMSVAIATRGATDRDGCRHVRIDVVTVQMGLAERVLNQTICGDLVSLGRDASATYFTWTSGDRVGVSYTGVSGVPHTVLRGHAMVSVSPNSDFLVTPGTALVRHRVQALGGDRSDVGGTVLFWRGHGGPVELGTRDHPLVVSRMLAWALDGARGLVVGRLGPRHGVFEVEAGPGTVRREPHFVTSGGLNLGAAYDENGVAYLAIDGRLMRYADGVLDALRLPEGGPPPAGPIAWLP